MTRHLRLVLLIAIIAVLVAIAILITFAIFTSEDQVGTANIVSGYWAFPALAVVLIGAAVGWYVRGSRRAARPTSPGQLDEAADWLMDEVYAEWRDEARRRGIGDNTAAKVNWVLNRALTSSAVGVADDAQGGKLGQLRGTLDDLYADIYNNEKIRHLYLLGPGGFGKTGAMITLLLHALDQRRKQQGQERASTPVPIWLNLADWNAVEESLPMWIGRSLMRDHPQLLSGEWGGKALEDLISKSRLSLFLDGFDEISVLGRTNALAEIRRASFAPKILVSSRSEEFAAAWPHDPALDDGTVAVSIAPITAKDAGNYLLQGRESDKSWQDFAEYLGASENSMAARTLNNPLTLSLARRVYANRDPWILSEEEVFSTPEEFRKHLFDGFVYTAYREDPTGGLAKLRWLMWFASCLGRSRDLYWWTVPRFLASSSLAVARWLLGPFTASLVISILIGVSYYREYKSVSAGIAYGFSSLVVALVACSLAMLFVGVWVSPVGRPPWVIKLRTPDRSEFWGLLVSWLTLGLTILVAQWLLYHAANQIVDSGVSLETMQVVVLDGIRTALNFVVAPSYFPPDILISLIGAGVIIALKVWSHPLTTQPSKRGVAGYRDSVRSTVMYSFAVGMIVGFLGARPFATTSGWYEYTWIAAVIFGVGGFAVTYFSLASPAALQLNELLFARRRGRIKIVSTLEDAAERGLLRREDWAYQFRHRLFQDYLAEQDPTQFS